MRPNTEADFWKKVNKGEGDCCWLWTTGKDREGYGFFWYKNKMIRAHRFVMGVILGKELGNLLVCHTCDNPSCVRPDHLFLGTVSDNAQDMLKKGRGLKGRKVPQEIIDKVAQKNRGKKRSEEFRKAVSVRIKGKKMSAESRLKMSIARTGLKRSEEAKRKTAETLRKKKLSAERGVP